MPEGDSIFRAAKALHRALAGKTVTSFETVLPKLAGIDEDAPLVGRTIERVISAGKNLIIEFSGDLHLHTHMKMNGSWHIYRPGERWQRPHRDMRIVIETADFVAVAFTVPVAEFHTSRSLSRDENLRRIGPDLLGATFDRAEAMRRIREHPNEEIANVLLNSSAAARTAAANSPSTAAAANPAANAALRSVIANKARTREGRTGVGSVKGSS